MYLYVYIFVNSSEISSADPHVKSDFINQEIKQLFNQSLNIKTLQLFIQFFLTAEYKLMLGHLFYDKRIHVL